MRRLSLWCLGRAITGGCGQFASTTTTPRETTHLINCYSRTGMRFIRGFSCSGVVGKDYIGHSKTKRVLDEETSNLEDDFWTGIEHSHRKVAYMHENADVQRITSPKSAGYHKQQRNESKGKFRNDSNGFRYARNREGMNEFIASSNNNYASTRRPKTLSGQKYGHSEGFPKKKERLDYQEHFRRPSVNHMRGDNHPGLEGRLPGLGKREKPRRPELQTSAIPKVQGEMLFGLHPVTLALNHSRRQAHCLYVRPRVKGDHSEDVDDSGENYLNSQVAEVVRLAEERGIPIKSLSRSQLDRCSNNRPHQGVCLDGSPLLPCPYKHADYQPAPIQDGCENSRLPLWLLLYRVQDPMNFGAILRSAYLFGVDRVLTTTHCCSLSPVVSKASAGALEVVDVFNISGQLADFVQSHQKLGWSVLATSSEKTPNIMKNYDRNDNSGEVNHKPTSVVHPTPIQDVQLEKPTILIVGNEGQGLPNPVLRVCDDVVCASVAPRAVTHSFDVDSLNVSVATGILLHTLMAKRG